MSRIASISKVHTIGSKDRYSAGLLATRGNCANRCGVQFMSYDTRVADVAYFYAGTSGQTFSVTVCEKCAARLSNFNFDVEAAGLAVMFDGCKLPEVVDTLAKRYGYTSQVARTALLADVESFIREERAREDVRNAGVR